MRVSILLLLIRVVHTCIQNPNRSTCSELGWDSLSFGNENICGGSICSSEPVSWNKAKKSCEDIGARMCSIFELHRGEAYNSGCSLNKLPVWSSTSCNNSTQNAVVITSNPFPSSMVCVSKENLSGYIRCCSDIYKCPTASPTLLPTMTMSPSVNRDYKKVIQEEPSYTIVTWILTSLTMVFITYFMIRKIMKTFHNYPKANYYFRYIPGIDVILNSIIHGIIRNWMPTYSQNKINRERQERTSIDLGPHEMEAMVDPTMIQLIDREPSVCLNCQLRPITHIIIPCGHHCICEECANIVSNCPSCDNPKNQTQKVYS